MSVESVVTSVLDRIRSEPVAVWGVILGALCTVLPVLGAPVAVVAIITTVAALLGIPVVRYQVTAKHLKK